MSDQKIRPSERKKLILQFVTEMEKFEEQHPGLLSRLDFIFDNFPTCTVRTPFHRGEITDDRINNFIKKRGKAILSRLYIGEWDFVKVISYQQFFVEHINMVDSHYETLYNILGDDIILTDMYVPTWMKIFDKQKHFYLKKTNRSI